jgi:hypothetical protein
MTNHGSHERAADSHSSFDQAVDVLLIEKDAAETHAIHAVRWRSGAWYAGRMVCNLTVRVVKAMVDLAHHGVTVTPIWQFLRAVLPANTRYVRICR